MRILLLNHYAGSATHGMEFRPYYLAREWSRLGCTVQVEAATFSHLRQQNPLRRRHVETMDGVTYSWWPTPEYSGNGAGRVRNIASFTVQLFRHAREVAASFRPDVVIASSTYPFDVFPARRIATAGSARLIFEVHDLWPLSPMELGGMHRFHPFIVACSEAEKYAYRHVDAVVSMLPAAEEHMRRRGLAPGKFFYVPNGFDAGEWSGLSSKVPARHAAQLQEIRSSGRFIVGYAGSHGIANALDTLLEAALRLRAEPVAVVVVGQGPERDRLRQRAKGLGLDNVYFLPPVPKSSIPDLLSSMDALYLGWLRRPIYRFGIGPNKLLDYMMSARPIIHSVEAGNDPVADAACGLSVGPEDADAVADAIRLLDRIGSQRRLEMGARGRKYALEHHDYSVLARRFLAAAAKSPSDAAD